MVGRSWRFWNCALGGDRERATVLEQALLKYCRHDTWCMVVPRRFLCGQAVGGREVYSMSAWRRYWFAWPLLISHMFCAASAVSAVTSEMQRTIRAATFEVVLKKPEKDPLTYEKPLPLDLLPYIERHDAYNSVGTAFALGGNTYVTAAHVLAVGIDSQFGAPALRRSDGTVYSIDRILKYSAHEDFVVFMLSNDPAPPGLAVNRTPKMDDPVFAVGNALGEGIVIRDGLLTSETAEEKDGLWKWLRFSAAASPGNSGGPLLDGEGKVIGIVLRKSQNENLNYSLPISRVLDAPDAKARFDRRWVSELPFMRGTKTYSYRDEFPLPMSWPAFVKAYDAVETRHQDESRAELLKAYHGSAFETGVGAESILYSMNPTPSYEIDLVEQQSDNTWTIVVPDYSQVEVSDDGFVRVAYEAGFWLARIHRAKEALDDEFYSNSVEFMDIALKALQIYRTVGSDEVRVTSLGPALRDGPYLDQYGRQWQERFWALPYRDGYVAVLALPTPDGYDILGQNTSSSGLHETQERLRLMAHHATVSYVGTIPQWQSFLHRHSLLPEILKSVALQQSPGWTIRTPKFELSIPERQFHLDDHSQMGLVMGFCAVVPRVAWDIAGANWYRDEQWKSVIGLWRQPQPPKSAKQSQRATFAEMWERRPPYDGEFARPTVGAFESLGILNVPGKQPNQVAADLIYGTAIAVDGHHALEDILELKDLMATRTHILERATGPEVALSGEATATAADPLKIITSDAERAGKAGAMDAHIGQDLRGRLASDDFRELLGDPVERGDGSNKSEKAGEKRVGGLAAKVTGVDRDGRTKALVNYWGLVPVLARNRDLWQSFLAKNHFASNSAHSSRVTTATKALLDELAKKEPGPEWVTLEQSLIDSYVKERVDVARASGDRFPESYASRKTPCPTTATSRSGSSKPAIAPLKRSPQEFYPNDTRRAQIEGAVVVAIQVTPTGCGSSLGVAASSGSDDLDKAAMEFLETAEFIPAEADGRAIEGIYKTIVIFKLTDREIN